jgi:hypothetical protein
MLSPMDQLPMDQLTMEQAKMPRSRPFLALDASARPSRASQHQWQRP